MESRTTNNNINAIKEVRELFNELRSNLSRKETTRIRKELYKKEAVYNFLKEKEQEGSLTNKQTKALKNIGKYLKKLNNDFKKLQKYQDNITYGLDYLVNELNEEDYYEPTEIKSAFDGSYVLYERRGDKDNKLAIYEYFDIIRPYLKDMIDNNKAKGEWKIQLSMQIIFVFFTDANETREMHTKSDNITIMSGIETEDAIDELFNTFRRRYQEGLENKGVTINPKNKDNKCFQYAIIAALNYQNIDHNPEQISKLRPFINNYNWKDRVSITFERLEKI